MIVKHVTLFCKTHHYAQNSHSLASASKYLSAFLHILKVFGCTDPARTGRTGLCEHLQTHLVMPADGGRLVSHCSHTRGCWSGNFACASCYWHQY